MINFDKLSRKEKESLLNDLSVLRFKSGQFIVQQGETTARDQPSLYIIASGCASILIDGIEKLFPLRLVLVERVVSGEGHLELLAFLHRLRETLEDVNVRQRLRRRLHSEHIVPKLRHEGRDVLDLYT